MRRQRGIARIPIDLSPAQSVLAVGLVVTLGVGLPSPGLDLRTGADVPAAIVLECGPSLFELALQPILTVLVLIELAKLAAPRAVESLAGRAEPGSTPLPSLVGLVAVCLATVEAVRLYRAFDESGTLDGHRLSMVAGIASLVAGTALLIWLADRVRLPGLDRSGLWVVYALLAVGIVPYDLRNAVEAARAGVFPPSAIGAVLLAAILATLAIVFTRLTMMRALARSGVDSCIWSPILIWPPVVTAWIVGALVNALDRAGLFSGVPTIWRSPDIVMGAATGTLLPAIVVLYVRAIGLRDPGALRWRGRRVILSLLTVQATTLCVLALWLSTPQPFATQGPEIIAIVIVAQTLWLKMRADPPRGRTALHS